MTNNISEGMHATTLNDPAAENPEDVKWAKELSISAAAHLCPPGTDKEAFIATAKYIHDWLKE
jgi:hypothetical protein